MKLIAVILLAVGLAFATGTVTADDDPIPPPPPIPSPPTFPGVGDGDVNCVSLGVTAERGRLAEGNLTGDDEQDVTFDCGDYTMTFTIDDITLCLLVRNSGATTQSCRRTP